MFFIIIQFDLKFVLLLILNIIYTALLYHLYYIYQSLLTKSCNLRALEMEVQPHHMTFTSHHIDLS